MPSSWALGSDDTLILFFRSISIVFFQDKIFGTTDKQRDDFFVFCKNNTSFTEWISLMTEDSREQHSPNDSSWCPLHCSQLMPVLSLSLGNCLLHVIMMVTTDNQHYFTSLLRGEWTAWEKNSCEKRRISCRFLFSYTKYFKWLFGRQFWQHFSSIIKMRHYSSSCQTVIDILSEEWTHILTGLCRFLSPFLSLWCWAWWMFMAPLVGMHEKGEIKGKRGRRCKRLLLSQRERERKRQLMRRSDFNYDINNGRA